MLCFPKDQAAPSSPSSQHVDAGALPSAPQAGSGPHAWESTLGRGAPPPLLEPVQRPGNWSGYVAISLVIITDCLCDFSLVGCHSNRAVAQAKTLSQGFKSEAAQPFPALWCIFPLAPRHHGSLAMASLSRRWPRCPRAGGMPQPSRCCMLHTWCMSALSHCPSQPCTGMRLAVGLPAPVTQTKPRVFYDSCMPGRHPRGICKPD